MCRLAAYAGEPAPAEPLVFGGPHSLARQSWEPRELLSGSVNVDGWGVVWHGRGRRPVRVARTEPLWHDPDGPDLLAALDAPVVVAALRNATPGLPIDRSALLPMVHERRSFVLNGFVPDFRARHMRALRADLPDHLYAALAGVSDAETLFLLAVAALEDGASPFEALDAVVGAVAERLPTGEQAPLTLVLADESGVWALNSGVGDGPRNSLYVVEEHPLAPRGALLASEAFDDHPAWRPVTARVRLADGRAVLSG